METKLAKISNKVFKYLIFLFISFVWCNYYTKNLFICLITSLTLASLLSFVTTKIFYYKQNKKSLKLADEKQIKNISIQLMFYSKEEQVDYFFNVLSFTNSNLEKTKQYIKLKNNAIKLCKNFIFFCRKMVGKWDGGKTGRFSFPTTLLFSLS